MADINITLDATDAIADSKALDAALDKLEKSAKSVKATFNKLGKIILHARLNKNVAFRDDYTVLKNKISLHSKKNPIILHTKIAEPKKTTTERFKGAADSFSGGTVTHPPRTPDKFLKEQARQAAKIAEGDAKHLSSLKSQSVLEKERVFRQEREAKKAETINRIYARRTHEEKIAREGKIRHVRHEKYLLDLEEKKTRELKKQVREAKKLQTYAKAHADAIHKSRLASRTQPGKQLAQRPSAEAWQPSWQQRLSMDKATKPSSEEFRGMTMEEMREHVAGKTRKRTKDEAPMKEGKLIPPVDKSKEFAKDLTKADDLTKKIAESTPKSLGDVQNEYKKLNKHVGVYSDQLRKGKMTQADYNAAIKKTENRLKQLNKETKKAKRAGSIMGSVFGKITMTLTAIAASLFILQELKQYFTALISIGSEYIKTLADIQAQTMMTAEDSESMADTLKDMGKGTALGLKDTYAAYKELRKAGLDHASAMEKSATAAKIARNEDIKLAEAAKIAAYGTEEMTQKYLKFNDAMKDTATDAWAMLKKDVADVIQQFYKGEQTLFVTWIKRITTLVTNLLPGLLAGMKALMFIFEVTLTTLTPILTVLGGIAKIIGTIPPLSSIFDLGKQRKISLDDQLKIAEENLARLVGTMKSVPKDFIPEIAFDTGDTKKIEFTFEKIQEYATSSSKKIANMAKAVLALRDAVKELGAETSSMKPEEAFKHHQKVQQELGITTKYLHDQEMILLDQKQDKLEDAAKATAEFGDKASAAEMRRLALIIKEVDKYKLRQKEIVPVLRDQKKYFDIMGVSAGIYFKNRETQLQHEINLMKIRGSLSKEEIKNYEIAKKFANKQAQLKAVMEDYANAFKLTGIMADKFYQNRIAQINEEIRKAKERNAELDLEYLKRLKIIMLDREKEAPTIERHEAIFETTGKQTQYLTGKKEEYAKQDYDLDLASYSKLLAEKAITMREYDDYAIQRTRQLEVTLLEISRQGYQSKLEAARAHFEATGVLSNDYRVLAIADMENLKQQALTKYPEMEKEIEATFTRMQQNMVFDWEAPKLKGWQEVYDQTGIMVDDFYDMKKKRIIADYNYDRAVIGDSLELHESYMRKLMDLDIQRLQSSEDACDGIRAAWYRLYQDLEPLGKQIADDWIAGMQAFEQASKDVFMGFMENTFETWEDQKQALLGILKSIQRMFNEMLWDIIKSKVTKAFFKTFGEKIFGENPAALLNAQAAATKQLAKDQAAQTATVAALTAANWAYYASLLAIQSLQGGMGYGTWGGQNATGAGTSMPRGGGGGGYGFQHGGKIEEEIFGVGQRTGKKYSFGEHGTKEYVIPENKMGAILGGQSNTMADNAKLASLSPTINVNVPEQKENSISINIPLSIEGNEKLGMALRNDIEELVQEKLREEFR